MKDKRSSKWAFILYKESAPKDYLQVLDSIHIPYILSPWHDKDVNPETGELKKAHKHGCLDFDSVKSYSQVSELINDKLNGPSHVEIVQSPRGMFDYFTHADNPEKTHYSVDNIEYGCGFDLSKFLQQQASDETVSKLLDIIEENNITEFRNLVSFVRDNESLLLEFITKNTYFFSKYLDSKRHLGNKK